MKLHLGCGERYLKGYINVDFPSTGHTVQKEIVADKLIDIKKLKYPFGSIKEIRLHHVFEHFPRAVACALLTNWYTWLEDGGTLRIEVPDCFNMAEKIINPRFTVKKKLVAERHIFGSQEAGWATHFAFYTPINLTNFLKSFGFKIIKIKKNKWKDTANFEVWAIKDRAVNEFEKVTREYLSQFLIDNSESEKQLLKVWIKNYNENIAHE